MIYISGLKTISSSLSCLRISRAARM